MKKNISLLVIFFAIFLSKNSYCQKEDKPVYKFGIELNNSLSFSSITSTPTFTFRGWKHSTIDIGVGTNIIDEWFSRKPFTGISFTTGYKFYPVGKQQKLNFYFHYSMKHYIFLSKLNGYSSNSINYNEHFLGYGFDVPIGKRFYFNHDLGVGVLTEWEAKSKNTNLGIAVNFRLGFGYKFGEKK
jgi:hypothetical protein